MNDEQNFFPRFIDRQRMVGVVEMDEFFTFFGVTFAGMIIALGLPEGHSGSFILGSMTLGMLSAWVLKKMKSTRAEGYTLHLFYRKGIIHPSDNKKDLITHEYLKDMRSVPYGFTEELIN